MPAASTRIDCKISLGGTSDRNSFGVLPRHHPFHLKAGKILGRNRFICRSGKHLNHFLRRYKLFVAGATGNSYGLCSLLALAFPQGSQQIAFVKIEHFALQVPDPAAMADWYVEHLGCSVARSGGEPSHGRFLLDDKKTVMLEIYRNPKATVPDYTKIDPLLLHLAFISRDPAKDRDRLVRAGAQVMDDLMTTEAGDQIVMLRDPWGIALQLVKRAEAMV